MGNVVFEITLRPIGDQVVEATGGTGGRVVMGPKGTPDSFTPVELLLAAIAGCSGLDLGTAGAQSGVDVGEFELRVRGTKPIGGDRLSQISVTYATPGVDPEVAASLVDAVKELCTVALTVSAGCPVEHTAAT